MLSNFGSRSPIFSIARNTQGERIVIHRRGRDAAAIISIEDLKLLERLMEDAEDRLDVEAARDALAESDERIPYAAVRKKLGLDDEQKANRARSQGPSHEDLRSGSRVRPSVV